MSGDNCILKECQHPACQQQVMTTNRILSRTSPVSVDKASAEKVTLPDTNTFAATTCYGMLQGSRCVCRMYE